MASKKFSGAVILRFSCLGFLLGIFLAGGQSFFDERLWILIPLLSISFLIFWRFERRFLVYLLLGFFALIGFWRYQAFTPAADSVANFTDSSFVTSGVIVDIERSEKSQSLTLTDLKLDDLAATDKLLVFAPLFPRFEYGERVTLKCELERPQPLDGFHYERFLAVKGIYATCYSRSAPIVIENNSANPILTFLWQTREKIIAYNDKIFGEPEASLMIGLLLGEERFSDPWQEVFLRTGTTHIVAASGYNVAVVTKIIFALLIFLGLRRPRAFAFILAAIIAYVILAGAEAAVVRAGVMGVLVLLSTQLGRKSTMTNVILLTAGSMLLFNPLLMRDSVGFQLSMLSTIGLIYFSPKLEKKLQFIPETVAIRESVTATLAATIFTLPIIIFSFGRISLVSLLANVLILPIIPYAMFFGSLAILVGLVSLPLATIFSAPAWALLHLMLFFVSSLADLPFASLNFL